jgi:serine/threonine protein phosphatase 1
MATLAVGDIHGCLPPLTEILERLRRETTVEDTVVFLGDYIDRGPSSRQCVQAILDFKQDVPARVVCLLGNHEDWMLETLHDSGSHSWLLGMGGLETIESYSADAATAIREAIKDRGSALYLGKCELPYEAFFDAVPRAHREFFDQLQFSIRTDDCFCSHAGVDPEIERLEDQMYSTLVWGASRFPDEYRRDETIVYGHWNNAVIDGDGWPGPRIVGRTYGIDTIKHGVLTAVSLPGGHVIQSARSACIEGLW